MNSKRTTSGPALHWMYFGLVVTVLVALYAFYAVNLVRWRESPDFGWRTMYDSGPNVVAEVLEAGREAGLRVGDTIVAINGQPYTSFDELFFRVRSQEPGSVNTYTVKRNGQTTEIAITTGRLGWEMALKRSGPMFVIGLVYAFIGALVFLMKPRAGESWIFLIMTCLFGVDISYSAPSDLMSPLWLYDVRLLIDVMLPAPMVHLALCFPRTREIVLQRPWLKVIPYGLTLSLFVVTEIVAKAYWDIPPLLDLLNNLLLLLGVLIFLASLVWNVMKDSSVVIRLQSQAIFVGTLLGFLIPTTDLLSRVVWQVYLFPDPVLGFAVFLSMFPLSIGYTIVKHDLFAIDVIVRRTYGYLLSTAAIVGTYAVIVLVLNVTFRSAEIARSPVFSILFALGVVFFFRPLHERIQGLVDRVFYRQHYDYRKTIKDISEAMISILDPEQIYRTLLGSVVKEMFLENGLLLLPDLQSHGYRVQLAEGDGAMPPDFRQLDEEAALPQLLKEKKDAVFSYEAELNPAYESQRDSLQESFRALASEVMLPLTYKNEVRGIISLGRKKSGKMFTLEDLDLLKTIANQSAVALENAKLFAENIEKSRMEEELKIAHDLQSSMLPESAPQIEGFTIAAKSISAREVGGDFYDFIEIGGNGACERLAIVVGDVSGKAVSGALVMAASRSIFRVLAEADTSVKEVMSIGNARLLKDVKKGMFVALLYALLDAGARTLTLSNAGQTQPVMCSDGKPEPVYIDTEGDTFPLGILKESAYEETRVPLKRGDTVVFYTDGVVEAMNGKAELYGFERLLQTIEEGRGLGASALLQKLLDAVTQFVGTAEQHDDLTIVVVKVD